jgi:hypothetical protein
MRTALVLAAFGILQPAISLAGALEVYEQLKSLVGDWEADLPGYGKIDSSIRLVSNGKAIEEIIGTSNDNELSVYTLNADTILLTHFCAMTPGGHQVRLQTPRLGYPSGHLDFNFASATNLHSTAAPHMRRVIMTISDRDHYSEKWTRTEDGKESQFDLNFVRRELPTGATQ